MGVGNTKSSTPVGVSHEKAFPELVRLTYVSKVTTVVQITNSGKKIVTSDLDKNDV